MYRFLFLVTALAVLHLLVPHYTQAQDHSRHTWHCAFDDATLPEDVRKTWSAIDLSQIRFVFVVPQKHLRPKADSIQTLIDRSIQIANDAAAARNLPASFRFAQYGELIFWDYDFPRFTTDEERSYVLNEINWLSGRDSTAALREQVSAETGVPATAANIKITFLYDGVLQDFAAPTLGTADIALDWIGLFPETIPHETFGHLLGVGHTSTLTFSWNGQEVHSIMYPVGFSNRTYGWYDDTIRAWGFTAFSAVSTQQITLPTQGRVQALFPNPVHLTATVRFAVGESGRVRISVFNPLEQRVLRLPDQWLPAGVHERWLDASVLANGSYVLTLEGNEFRDSKPFVVLQ